MTIRLSLPMKIGWTHKISLNLKIKTLIWTWITYTKSWIINLQMINFYILWIQSNTTILLNHHMLKDCHHFHTTLIISPEQLATITKEWTVKIREMSIMHLRLEKYQVRKIVWFIAREHLKILANFNNIFTNLPAMKNIQTPEKLSIMNKNVKSFRSKVKF